MRTRKCLFWVFAGLALACGLAFTIRYLILEWRNRNEQTAAAMLKLLTVAEVDFRSNDRDDNQINDFWTGDVAGLFRFGLIDREVAEADAAPLQSLVPTARPYHGYFLCVLVTDETGAPYAGPSDGKDRRGAVYNTSKFGFCAYPANYPTSGRWTFIVNEGNTIFKQDAGGKPVLRYPLDSWNPSDYCNPN